MVSRLNGRDWAGQDPDQPLGFYPIININLGHPIHKGCVCLRRFPRPEDRSGADETE